MLCEQCGATNTEPAQFCRNCGHSLSKQQNMPISGSLPEQEPAGSSKNTTELAIDELPTAHVPSVANPPGFAPVSQLPFTSEFPLEIEQAPATQEPPDEDATLLAPPPSLASAGKSMFALPTRPKNASSPALTGTHTLHAQPMRGVPLEQVPSPQAANANEAPAQEKPDEQGTLLSQNAGFAPVEPNGQRSQTPQSLFYERVDQDAPTQTKQNGAPDATVPFTQVGAYANAPANQKQLPPQISQNGTPDATLPFSLVGMYPLDTQPDTTRPPSQLGRDMPTFQAEMYATSIQPGMGGSSMPQGAMELQAPPAGNNWYDYPTQTPPVPERLGNVYPGPPDTPAFYGSASQGGMIAPAGTSPGGETSTLLQPLPRWVMVVGPLAGAALLAGLIFVYSDWATGAVVATLVAITLAILLGIAAGVRITLGMLKESNPRRRSQVISTALIIGILLLFSGVGVSQQNNLHMAQGRYLEGHQSWSLAIAEYQAAGEKSSSALDVARTYDEWGEAQNRQKQYASAVTSFGIVLQNYQGAADELSRAQRDSVTSYLDWANQATQQQNYVDATTHYDTLLTQTFCGTACQSLAQPKDATAYYQLAEQLLAQHHYLQAANSYQTLSTRFPHAPEVGQIHAHYAQALWGKGQQELNTACSDALSTYRLLVKSFADTSQGRQAASALTQPVGVKGHFTQPIPGAPFHPTAYLVQGLFAGIQPEQFPALLANAPSALIHSDGTFTFSGVAQGKYELIWSSDGKLHFYYAFSGQHVLYTAQLGPLCTYNYGDINQAIPT